MKLPRAFLIWVLMMLLESFSGILRQQYLAPRIGDLFARQVGVLIGSAIVLCVALLSSRWVAARTFGQQIATGLFWVILTIVFELYVGRLFGFSWERILADYDPGRGGFMGFGLLVMLFAPWLGSKMLAGLNS